MARNREKKSLYEVMTKATLLKQRYDKTVEPLHPEKSDKEKQTKIKFLPRMYGRAAKWLNKPRIVQFNNDRIEISLPYQFAIVLILGLILLFLIAFWLGQITYRSSQKATISTSKASTSIQKAVPAEEKAPLLASTQKVEPAKSKGDNRIVIQTFQLRADLVPVKQYFAQFGIETEIIKISDWYYLVTKDKYENPAKAGTDGYIAKQKIIELGAKYKAPQGYETFGDKPFSDAYGMKFDE
jgi:hypothetical protein